MLLRLCTVFDAAAAVYLPPFTVRAIGEAKRMVLQTMGDPNTLIAKHPEQFYLFEIGTYDDSTGVIAPGREHVLVGKALDLKAEASGPGVRRAADQNPLNAG